MIIQRPYGIIADPDDAPKAIFVSAFDSAPLAPDYNFALAGEKAALQRGVEVLKKLTAGKVHVSFRAGAEGRSRYARRRRVARLCRQTSRGQRRRADPPHRSREQGRGGLDGQHPGSGHDRPFLLDGQGRSLEGDRRDRLWEVAQPQYCRVVDGRHGPIRSSGGNVKPQAGGATMHAIISGNVLTGVEDPGSTAILGYYAQSA